MENPTELRIDNTGAAELASDSKALSRSKHIDIRYHHRRRCVADKVIQIERVASEDGPVGIFTNPLDKGMFIKFREDGRSVGSQGDARARTCMSHVKPPEKGKAVSVFLRKKLLERARRGPPPPPPHALSRKEREKADRKKKQRDRALHRAQRPPKRGRTWKRETLSARERRRGKQTETEAAAAAVGSQPARGGRKEREQKKTQHNAKTKKNVRPRAGRPGEPARVRRARAATQRGRERGSFKREKRRAHKFESCRKCKLSRQTRRARSGKGGRGEKGGKGGEGGEGPCCPGGEKEAGA
ncbi:MAG: hypothetical protein BJ554DRAFT_3904 [Olpidium bornovanus]|uniref:Uncharacterized protein n=1 Tax=Olpidium bornovanus TaxID=278681 RepID=A0A8H8DL95_9FUNG|nr:MAG: hypothetical protein BJ554DRAFT_3904 [Olpidium bornovanus]